MTFAQSVGVYNFQCWMLTPRLYCPAYTCIYINIADFKVLFKSRRISKEYVIFE
jgi:hypothetical protein